MKKTILGFLLFTAGLLTVSCSGDKNEEILKYTTDKTMAVVKINLEQLDSKLPKKEIMKDTTNHFSKSEKEKMELFMNAGDNGIDIDKPLYILTDYDQNNFVTSFLGWLNDENKFVTNFSKITGSKITIDKAKSLVYADGNIIGSIKDDLIVLSRSMSNPYATAYGQQATDGSLNEKFYKEFWTRKPLESKNKIEQIDNSLTENADMSSWVNLYGVISTVSKGYVETLAINKLLVDAGIGLNLSFEKGQIQFNTKTFFNEDLKKLVEKHYKGKEVDYNVVKNIDLDSAKAYGIGYVSFDFLRYFVKEAGFEAMVNSYLAEKNITFEEITNALNGKYAFASYANEAVEATEENPYAYSQPRYALVLGINANKAKKLLDVLKTEPLIGSYAKMFNNNEVLAMSSDDKSLELIKTNKAAANKSLDKKTGVNSYSWSNAEDFNKGFAGKGKKVKLTSIVSVSNVKDGNATSETTVALDKKDKNALHYIMGYE